MKNFKLPKSLVCLLIVSIVVAGFTIAPVLGASNHKVFRRALFGGKN